jgi:integrase/recombinase XerD
VLAIPAKRNDTTIVNFLTQQEVDAVIAAIDTSTWHGRRDHALLVLAAQTGLRVSELTGLTTDDIHLGTGPHVYCRGKGRRDRCTPLTPATVQTLTAWLRERGGDPGEPAFPTRAGNAPSRDAVARLLAKYVRLASEHCPALTGKTISPHTLRHYVEGRVMWLAAASPLVAEPRVLVAAT